MTIALEIARDDVAHDRLVIDHQHARHSLIVAERARLTSQK